MKESRKVAFLYDFDLTLSPRNMQEFSFQDLKNRVSLAYILAQKKRVFLTPEKAALPIFITFHTGIKKIADLRVYCTWSANLIFYTPR